MFCLVLPALLLARPISLIQYGQHADKAAQYGVRAGAAVEGAEKQPIVLKPGDRVRIKGSDVEYVVGEDGLVLPIGVTVKVNAKAPTSKVAQIALRYLGTPYSWGGNDLKRGIDTSHFVYAVLSQAGRSVPKPPVLNQEQHGRIVHWRKGTALRGNRKIVFKTDGPPLEALRPGDRLIIQHEPLSQRAGGRHTGIYIGAYDGPQGHFRHAVVHASSRGVAVVEFSSFAKGYRYTVRD